MFLLAVMGLVLLVPPVVTLFNRDVTIWGMPQIVVYLFVVWFLLIVGTVLLTRFLPREGTGRGDEGSE